MVKAPGGLVPKVSLQPVAVVIQSGTLLKWMVSPSAV